MTRPQLYLDEDVYIGVATALGRRGYTVLTTFDAGRRGASDEDQLLFAASRDMCIFSFNRGDFARIHKRMTAQGGHHCGIILSRQVDLKTTIRMLCAFLADRKKTDLYDQLIWLSTGTRHGGF